MVEPVAIGQEKDAEKLPGVAAVVLSGSTDDGKSTPNLSQQNRPQDSSDSFDVTHLRFAAVSTEGFVLMRSLSER
jgi:hypothetical protein